MSRTLTVLLALIVMISGCINDSEKSTSTKEQTSNDVILRLDAEPSMLNPFLTTSSYSRQVLDQIFQSLVAQDPVSLDFIPQLATALPTHEDITEGSYKGGIKYNFEIRPEAKWDDGQPITAADYIFSIKTIMIPTLQTQIFRSFLDVIKDVEVSPQDPKKFSVILKEKSILGEEVASGAFRVVPAHLYDKEGALTNIPLSTFLDKEKIKKLAKEDDHIKAFVKSFNAPEVGHNPDFIRGSGPYKVKDWKTGESITLVKKENWWGKKFEKTDPGLADFPDKLIYKIIPETAVLSSLVKSEKIDALSGIPAQDFKDLQENSNVNTKYNFYSTPSLAVYFIALNTRNPLLKDKRVRKALAHVVNVEELIDQVMGGFAERTNGPVHPSLPYYNADLQLIDFNPEKARALLQEAGWKDSNSDGTVDKVINGERTELIIPFLMSSKSSRQKEMLLLLTENAKLAGIGIQIEALEFNTLKAKLKKFDYAASIFGRGLSPTLWNPKQSWATGFDNRTGFGNKETDALIEKILVTMDEEERNRLYKKLQAYIYDELPEIPLFTPSSKIIVHKRFEMKPSIIHPGYFPNYFKLKK